MLEYVCVLVRCSLEPLSLKYPVMRTKGNRLFLFFTWTHLQFRKNTVFSVHSPVCLFPTYFSSKSPTSFHASLSSFSCFSFLDPSALSFNPPTNFFPYYDHSSFSPSIFLFLCHSYLPTKISPIPFLFLSLSLNPVSVIPYRTRDSLRHLHSLSIHPSSRS